MMNKEQKKQYINDMSSQFNSSEAVIVTHYQGLTVSQLDDLRGRMREHGIKFKITNNRITKLALEKTKCKDLSNLLYNWILLSLKYFVFFLLVILSYFLEVFYIFLNSLFFNLYTHRSS